MTECIDTRIHIEVPSKNHGLYAIDILDPSLLFKLFHIDIVYYYHNMIQKLLDWGYEAGTTLFGFGYDFRQSVRIEQILTNFKARLETAYKESGKKKVNIVTHSMGGLLVKCFLALHQQDFEKYVNKWVAIACPFQGAPAYMYECLLTGIEFLNGIENLLFVSKTSIRQLLIECPSIYELLSDPGFKWESVPHLQIWRQKYSEAGEVYADLESYCPEDCVTILEKALEYNEIHYKGQTIPLPFNHAIMNWAKETLKILKMANLPKGVKFYNIYGASFQTASDLCYGTEVSPIQDLQEILQLEPLCSYVDGDGTVPVESAMADELDAEMRIGLPFTHRGLMSEYAVFEILGQYLEVPEDHKILSDYVSLSIEKFEAVNMCQSWDTISEDSEDYNVALEEHPQLEIKSEPVVMSLGMQKL